MTTGATSSLHSVLKQYCICYMLAPNPVSLIRVVCFFTCRAKKVVQLPDYHFVDHRIEITSHDNDYNRKVKLYEHAKAHSGLPRLAK